MYKIQIFLIFVLNFVLINAEGEDDLIKSLPGVDFEVKFKQYSGYLNAGNNGNWKFFYWLTESQTGNSDNDALLIWFNGGPGCSSVGGMFEELGPFYVDKDGKTVYENIYSWNKYANVLAIESPIGVGFSYDTTNFTAYTLGDDLTAQQNLAAISDFFSNIQPKYKNRRWFIAGESYAGIYIPTVTKLILNAIVSGTFPNTNFGGIAIGNGYMNIKALTNSLVLWTNYHGFIAVREWDNIKELCCNGIDADHCDFASNFDFTYMNGSKNDCGTKILYYLNINSNLADPYNFYQDCYLQNYLSNTKDIIHKGLLGTTRAVKDAKDLNYDSSDNQFAFPCYNGDSARAYLKDPAVQKAFNVDQAWTNANHVWHGCNNDIDANYPVKYIDTTEIFNDIIKIATDAKQYVQNFNILIYNGDVDTVCNFLGDAWHMENIATTNNFIWKPRYPWIFRNQIAGYHQPYFLTYNTFNGHINMTIDVITVKGSGHFVPNDKQGPSLQMITNFIKNAQNYNNSNGIEVTPLPNNLITSTTPPSTTRSTTSLSTTTMAPSTTLSIISIILPIFHIFLIRILYHQN